MANIKLYTRNALAAAGVVLKNGTGGGAPALEQDADWPMSHLLSPDRETYWRMGPTPSDAVQVDFDLGSAQTIVALGVARLRLYGTLTEVGQSVSFYYGTGSTYPPSWVSLGGIDLSNNNALTEEFGSISARFWRFQLNFFGFANTPASMKLWLVKSADRVDLGHDWSIGTEEETSRLRQEVESPAGLAFAFEPGQNRGSTTRSGKYELRHSNETLRDSLRDQLTTLDTRFMVVLGDGVTIETALPQGELAWSRRWSAPDRFDFSIPLVEHP